MIDIILMALKILMAGKFGIGYFGGLILVQGLFGVLLEALGIFLGFDFCPHSIARVASRVSPAPLENNLPEQPMKSFHRPSLL